MKKTTRKLLAGAILAGLALPLSALAADDAKRIEDLEAKVKKLEEKSLGKWLTISGDYRFRYDYLKGKVAPYADGMTVFGNVPTVMGLVGNGTIDVSGLNQQQIQQLVFGTAIQGGTFGATTLQSAQRNAHNVENTALYSNRFGLNLKAKATQDVTFTTRLLMYKFAGAQDDSALRDGNTAYSFDRAGLFDGTIGHVPSDNKLAVDRVYATWNNIAEQPIWFSIGRRPSTGGVPAHLRQNTEKPGNAGVPALLVDYAFDGVTIGYAPEIDALPGAYAKFCYGRGFQEGIQTTNSNSLHNTDMIGLNIVPYETDALRVELQYDYGMEIFDAPKMLTGPFPLSTTKNLGNIHWFGLDLLGTVKHVGIGNLTWFAAGGVSRTDSNGKTLEFNGLDSGYGLLFSGKGEDVTGWAAYLGGRYDIESTRTKVGFEYNHGSKNWITFAPAADDMWTSKVGVRGNVYEGYIIQELPLEPISSYLSKAFFKLGYQYYDFEYTGSNSWLGAPVKISDLNSMFPQLTAPLDSAQNLYVTFEVHF